MSCSLRCKGCQFSECLDSSFAFFNKAKLLKNNMEIFAIRFSRKKFQKHHTRQRKVPRSVYKLAVCMIQGYDRLSLSGNVRGGVGIS